MTAVDFEKVIMASVSGSLALHAKRSVEVLHRGMSEKWDRRNTNEG